VNLYRKMVRRQDAMVKLLLDIRDNTKSYSAPRAPDDSDSEEDAIPHGPAPTVQSSYGEDSSPFVCSACEGPVWPEDVKCRRCGADVQAFEEGENAQRVRSARPTGLEENGAEYCFHCGEALPKNNLSTCPRCGKRL